MAFGGVLAWVLLPESADGNALQGMRGRDQDDSETDEFDEGMDHHLDHTDASEAPLTSASGRRCRRPFAAVARAGAAL